MRNDSEWHDCLLEAAHMQRPCNLCELFAAIIFHCNPSNPKQLWRDFQKDLSEDFMHHITQHHQRLQAALGPAALPPIEKPLSPHSQPMPASPVPAYPALLDSADLDAQALTEAEIEEYQTQVGNTALAHIHVLLIEMGLDCGLRAYPEILESFTGFDIDNFQPFMDQEINNNIESSDADDAMSNTMTNLPQNRLQNHIQESNTEQRHAYEIFLDAIRHSTHGNKLFFLDDPGGTGKSFVYNNIIAAGLLPARPEEKLEIIAIASSGIAALNLHGGHTAHSVFKIPLDIEDGDLCTCNIDVQMD